MFLFIFVIEFLSCVWEELEIGNESGWDGWNRRLNGSIYVEGSYSLNCGQLPIQVDEEQVRSPGISGKWKPLLRTSSWFVMGVELSTAS